MWALNGTLPLTARWACCGCFPCSLQRNASRNRPLCVYMMIILNASNIPCRNHTYVAISIIYSSQRSSCTLRSAKDQGAVRDTQDKVLAGLRGLSSSLAPNLQPLLKEALLSLLAQPEFIRKVTRTRRALYTVLRKYYNCPNYHDHSSDDALHLLRLQPLVQCKE